MSSGSSVAMQGWDIQFIISLYEEFRFTDYLGSDNGSDEYGPEQKPKYCTQPGSRAEILKSTTSREKTQ